MHNRFVIAAAVVVAGCSSRTAQPAQPDAPPAVAAPVMLAYALPTTRTLTYEYADSTDSDIQAGPAGSIKVNLGARGVIDLSLEPAGSDLKVIVTVREFAGSSTNSAGGGVTTATASDVKGPALLTVTPRGAVTIVQLPQMTPIFRQVAGSDGIFRRFFVRLPGRATRIGATWTDTLVTQETNEGLTTRVQNIVTSTWSGDSAVAGHTFHVITAVSQRTLEMKGTTQGVEIVQKLSGPANSVTLWDPERRVIVSRDETVQMNGTFDLPAMSMTNMPITSKGRVSVRLRD